MTSGKVPLFTIYSAGPIARQTAYNQDQQIDQCLRVLVLRKIPSSDLRYQRIGSPEPGRLSDCVLGGYLDLLIGKPKERNNHHLTQGRRHNPFQRGTALRNQPMALQPYVPTALSTRVTFLDSSLGVKVNASNGQYERYHFPTIP
jgi:hypothetical protein